MTCPYHNTPSRSLAALVHAASTLNPAYFAFVMATGIVSNELFLHGQIELFDALFVVNMIAYPWHCLFSLLRAGRSTGAVWRDLTNPRRAFLFFTAVGATNVFAMSIALHGFTIIAFGIWLLALALWIVLIYLGFGAPMFRNRAGGGGDIVEGEWLNAVIATQSLVIVGGAVTLRAAGAGPQAFLFLPMLWGIGLILYALLLEIWRHAVHRVAIGYTPLFWSIVFPCGMYATATFRLSAIASAPALHSLSAAMTWIALAAWCATALSSIAVLLRSARGAVGSVRVSGGSSARRGTTDVKDALTKTNGRAD